MLLGTRVSTSIVLLDVLKMFQSKGSVSREVGERKEQNFEFRRKKWARFAIRSVFLTCTYSCFVGGDIGGSDRERILLVEIPRDELSQSHETNFTLHPRCPERTLSGVGRRPRAFSGILGLATLRFLSIL